MSHTFLMFSQCGWYGLFEISRNTVLAKGCAHTIVCRTKEIFFSLLNFY